LIVAPHLPIGSPERSAFFREVRRTFAEDWKAAEEAERQERVTKAGDLYFIRAGDAVKIGRTTNIVKRLHNMQTNNHEEIDCLLLLKGRGWQEDEWHKRFRAMKLRGEWYRWCAQIEAAIDLERNLAPRPTLSEVQKAEGGIT
jgi:hypothetical protein